MEREESNTESKNQHYYFGEAENKKSKILTKWTTDKYTIKSPRFWLSDRGEKVLGLIFGKTAENSYGKTEMKLKG